MGNKHTVHQPTPFFNESPVINEGLSRTQQPPTTTSSTVPQTRKAMDRLRKSFRGSFRKKKDHHITESSKPHQWQADEQAVRSGTCSFPVKYLGCVEVFESRGMHVCEEALKLLRSSRRRPFTSSIKGTLFVTGDGLRVVDEETKGLIVDQTIEKVSFCAPDRNHEKGFSYICRDGTTRRWICHGFHAMKDSGDRLSHAVGCAFAVCLERKQKRDKELVSMNFDSKTSTFTRTGSFRQASLTERLTDIQNFKPSEPPPIKPVHNPYAIERPHATPQLLQRQGSFRGLGGLSQSSPFKRQLSLRLNELPSNLGRTRSHSLESSSEQLPPPPRSNGALKVTPIPEASPASENKEDCISAMCQELSQGLSLLSNNDDPLTSPSRNLFQNTQSFIQRDASMATPSPIPVNDPFSAPATIPSSSPFSFNLNETRPGGSSPFDVASNEKKTSLDNIPSFAPTTSNLTQSTLTATTSTTTKSPITNPIYTGFNKNLTTQVRNHSMEANTREFASFPPSHRPTGSPLTSKSHRFQATSHSSFDSEFKQEKANPSDPFDADWVAIGSRNENDDSTNIHRGTNPFIPNPGRVKAFQVQM